MRRLGGEYYIYYQAQADYREERHAQNIGHALNAATAFRIDFINMFIFIILHYVSSRSSRDSSIPTVTAVAVAVIGLSPI